MRLGSIELDVPLCQAGLVGYSDRPMRVVARRRGCPYAVTEAYLEHFIADAPRVVRQRLEVRDDDHPLAGQIMGGTPEIMARAARVMLSLGHDVIDVNLACPVKKATKARGGNLLVDPETSIAVLRAVRDALPAEVPVTVKLRRGFDDSPLSAERFHRILEGAWSAGYAAACVHGRTVEQGYRGRARWDFLADLKRRHPGRVILGSGDVFLPQDALRMLVETGVDGVWIARGAIGNPWIFGHAATLWAARSGSPASPRPPPPTLHEQRSAMEEHLSLARECYGEAGLRHSRGALLRYTRFHPAGQGLRREMAVVKDEPAFGALLDRCYGEDGPGVDPPAGSIDEVRQEDTCA